MQNLTEMSESERGYILRSNIRKKFPNLKAGEMTSEAFQRHCNMLGGEPEIERLLEFVDVFDDTIRTKDEIADTFNWNKFQVDAFCFFAEAAGILEPYGRAYRPSFIGDSFFEQDVSACEFPEKKAGDDEAQAADRAWAL